MNDIFEGINLEICANPNAEQLIPIEEGLNNFNDLMTGMSDRLPLSVLLKSKTSGEVLGECRGVLRWVYFL